MATLCPLVRALPNRNKYSSEMTQMTRVLLVIVSDLRQWTFFTTILRCQGPISPRFFDCGPLDSCKLILVHMDHTEVIGILIKQLIALT
jgi:hypothetical protein